MFASIPNFFQKFYSEEYRDGKQCLQVLNEIIFDFDSLLDEKRFSTIEKIKTVGSTYMVASGLNPKHFDEKKCVCDLVEFAIAMQQKLEEFNKHVFNLFELRVGEYLQHIFLSLYDPPIPGAILSPSFYQIYCFQSQVSQVVHL